LIVCPPHARLTVKRTASLPRNSPYGAVPHPLNPNSPIAPLVGYLTASESLAAAASLPVAAQACVGYAPRCNSLPVRCEAGFRGLNHEASLNIVTGRTKYDYVKLRYR